MVVLTRKQAMTLAANGYLWTDHFLEIPAVSNCLPCWLHPFGLLVCPSGIHSGFEDFDRSIRDTHYDTEAPQVTVTTAYSIGVLCGSSRNLDVWAGQEDRFASQYRYSL